LFDTKRGVSTYPEALRFYISATAQSAADIENFVA
jgi:hypothetical protein